MNLSRRQFLKGLFAGGVAATGAAVGVSLLNAPEEVSASNLEIAPSDEVIITSEYSVAEINDDIFKQVGRQMGESMAKHKDKQLLEIVRNT